MRQLLPALLLVCVGIPACGPDAGLPRPEDDLLTTIAGCQQNSDPRQRLKTCNLGIMTLEELRDQYSTSAGDTLIASLRRSRAEAYFALGDFEKAERDMRVVLAVDASNPMDHHNLGEAMLRQQRWSDARDAYDAAIARLPVDMGPGMQRNAARMYVSRGNALMQLGDAPGARRDSLRAVELDPGNAVAQNNLGYSYMVAGNNRLAAEHYRKALAINPGYGQARAGLREAERRLGA